MPPGSEPVRVFFHGVTDHPVTWTVRTLNAGIRMGALAFFLVVFTVGSVMAAEDPRSPEELRRAYDRHAVRGAPRDTFRVLENPDMAPAEQAEGSIRPAEWVIGVAHGGEAKAYPVSVMGMHELVNDTIAGDPIAVCW